MFYLSEGTEFFSRDKFERAQVMQRLFFEQYSHEPFIAIATAKKVRTFLTAETIAITASSFFLLPSSFFLLPSAILLVFRI